MPGEKTVLVGFSWTKVGQKLLKRQSWLVLVGQKVEMKTPDARFSGFPKLREVVRRRGTESQQAGMVSCKQGLEVLCWWYKTFQVEEMWTGERKVSSRGSLDGFSI